MQSAEAVASRGGVALREVGICVVICPVFLCPCAAVCPPLLASSGIPLHHGKCQSARPRPSVFSICSPLPFCCDSCIYVWCRCPTCAVRHTCGPTVLFLFFFDPMCICFILYVYVTSVCLSWKFRVAATITTFLVKWRASSRQEATRSDRVLSQPQTYFFSIILSRLLCFIL